MRALRLMADYDCYPLWALGAEASNVDPSSLSIPLELVVDLNAWAAEYSATLNRRDPAASGFADERAAEAWRCRGADLAARLRDEVFAVVLFDHGASGRDLVAGD